jgi:hypothetical protein
VVAEEYGRVEAGMAVSVLDRRYPVVMSEARDVVTDTGLEPEELAWLDDRIAEYQELLAYLRDH